MHIAKHGHGCRDDILPKETRMHGGQLHQLNQNIHGMAL